MTASPTDGSSPRHDERAPDAPEPQLDDRIGNRPPVWGSSAESPSGPIDVHAHPTEFELAYSGGWGAPGHVDATGPIPRLGRTADPSAPTPAQPPDETVRASESGETVHGLPADTATTWHSRSHSDDDPFRVTHAAGSPPGGSTAATDGPTPPPEPAQRAPVATSEHFVYSKPATSPGPTTRSFPTVDPSRTSGQPVSSAEAAVAAPESALLPALTDFGFRTRTTRVLAPLAYGLLVALLVVLYVANVYTAAMAAATAGTGLASAAIVSVVGLVALAFGVVAGRLLLELACNVSDLASRRDR